MAQTQLKSLIIATFFSIQVQVGCTPVAPEKERAMAIRLEKLLNEHTLEMWYPKVIDENNGGFHSNYAYDWTKEIDQNKFIVTQARHVWTLSKAYEFYPKRQDYKKYAQHGYQFLKDRMWDHQYGGFFQLVDSTGTVLPGNHGFEKRLYGNAFGIYALAAYYRISNDPEVLDLAMKAFHWLDKSAHDGQFGGYFQYLQRDGTVIPRSVLKEGYDVYDRFLVGLKDYNSSIHILEAFTELYKVWKDETLKSRLTEMFEIVSETMRDYRGFLKLHFYPDWSLVPDGELVSIAGDQHFYTNHVTFGHDVETAFLLLEAAEVLEIDLKEIMPKAKNFVDHALKKGWDSKKGGFYERGNYVDGEMAILDSGKNWWAQAEGINSLLLMHLHFPSDTSKYYQKFELLVGYIESNLIDHRYMGWFSGGVDHDPEIKTRQKAHIWKGTYHTSRSLMHCISLLRSME